MGSGVVLPASYSLSPIIVHTVPIRPVGWLASCRIERSMKLVVVLPFVPVMHNTTNNKTNLSANPLVSRNSKDCNCASCAYD